MSKPLHILIVEDSEDDALLLLRELRRGGYEPVSERVDTAEAMKAALEERRWDLIVSDYMMPKFSGLAALAIFKESGLDLPFIIVSGNIGEDIAVEAMKAGAHDYIIKGNLSRLVPAVERELRDAGVRRERGQAEEALKAEHSFRKTIEDSILVGITVSDLSGRLIYVNQAFCAMTGWSREELEGSVPPFVFWPPESVDDITKVHEMIISGNMPKGGFELRLRRRDEASLDTLFFISPINDGEGNTFGRLATYHDITERKEGERRTAVTNALLKLFAQKYNRKEYLTAAIELIRTWSGCRHVGLRIADGDGNIPYESCTGYSTEFLESENMLSVERDHCACTRVVAGKPEPQDLPAMTPNGSFYSNNSMRFVEGLTDEQKTRFRGVCVKSGFTSVAVIPVRYRDKVLGAIHIADEKEGMVPLRNVEFLEQMAFIIGEAVYRFEIEEERSRLASAVQSTAEAVVVTDSRGIVQYANPAFERITGYAKEEVVGRDLHMLDSGRHDEKFYSGMREALARDGVWNGQLINRKKDGALYFEECTMSPVRDASGEIINYVSVKRDVTEKLRLESIAESVDTMNNIGYVFTGVRHEIGNPINSINMILGLLRAKLDTLPRESVREYLNKMMEQISRVEYILRSLKSFNLYETQEPQDMLVEPFLQNFLPLIREDFEKKGIAIESAVAPDAVWMHADPRALQQVLLNVLTNASDAVSGREGPKVFLNVSRSGGMVRIRVEDNGCGIPEEKLRDIFKPFFTTKAHGTGLGLVIVKKMLVRMNGAIEIESKKDAGTVVNISIPEGREGA